MSRRLRPMAVAMLCHPDQKLKAREWAKLAHVWTFSAYWILERLIEEGYVTVEYEGLLVPRRLYKLSEKGYQQMYDDLFA